MTKTTARVSFGLFALELKEDANLSTISELQPFSKVDDLETDNVSTRPYASYEPNYWLLDGQYKFLPAVYTTIHVGLISLEMSDSAGDFTTAPQLTAEFSRTHDIDGLALRFQTYTGDYCSALTINYYDGSNQLIRSDSYQPDYTEFSTLQPVTGFKKIIITFHSTNRPRRYLRLTGIDFGELISFEGDAIKIAKTTEQVCQLSTELPYSELELELYSQEAQFSILNPAGQYAALKERQPLFVYEIVDGTNEFIGRYYLTEWENLSDTLYKFRAMDILGILDGMTYRGGLFNGEPLEDLIEAILAPISIPYELDNRLTGIEITGWIKAGSYREALQQIGFAAGAAIHATRSGVLRIEKTKIAENETAYATITRAEKGIEQSLALRPIVTGVEVTAHNYIPGGESQLVMSGEYAPGMYEIIFGEPMHALTIEGATILESGVNYATIAVAEVGTVALNGLKYIDTTAVTSVAMTGLGAGSRPNIIRVESATLVHAGNVKEIAQRVYDYYQQRYSQRVKLYAPLVKPGDVVIIDTLYKRKLLAVIEKMDSDLTLGFTAHVDMVGVDYGLG